NTAFNIITAILLLVWGFLIMMSPMLVASRGFEDRLSSILTAIFIIGYPVIIFVLYKLLGYKFFGMTPNVWLIGFSVATLLICTLYGFPGMLMNLKRGIPNSGYFIGESNVYLNGETIEDADPASFKIIDDSQYAVDHGRVYYYGRVVEGADPDSLGPVINDAEDTLGYQSPVYWKDNKHAIFEGRVMEGSDAGSFEYISGLYAKDANHIYYENEVLTQNDPDKVNFLNKGVLSDGEALYIYSKKSQVRVDLETVEVVENDYGMYIKDSQNVYLLFYRDEEPLAKVKEADPITFELMERYYAKDNNRVYYYGSNGSKPVVVVLKEADLKNFTLGYDRDTETEARDGVNHYMNGKLVDVSR
ncbi:hypothetical protein E1176_06190, partial [Fulvivirga sp. RKSG066]|uniref:DKNYY domain-containing protein n=1 Tax=Fulvivirga aurantia TaxID=2529383 RepID=UPI00162A6E67